LAALPTWAWLVVIVGATGIFEARAALRLPQPRIFGDELIYWELARSFSATGHFALRDVPGASYGIGYPLLIAPVFAVFKSLPAAYAAAKVVNTFLMSSAAVPAFFIGRRALSREKALVAAALTVLAPSMIYTGTIMTENAFYPVFLVCVWLTLRAVESPTTRRQLSVLAAFGVAFLIRAQAIALLPAYLTAVVAVAALEAEHGARRKQVVRLARTYRSTLTTLAIALAIAVAVEAGRGRTPAVLLGAYSRTFSKLSVTGIPNWFLYHLADLDVYLGFVPLAVAFAVVPLALQAGTARRLRLFVIVAISFVFWMMLLVAAFSTVPKALGQLHERNLFYVVPLFVIAFLIWLEDGERKWPLAGFVVAALLPLTLPFSSLVTTAASDALALTPWAGFPWKAVPLLLAIAGCGAAVISHALRGRYALLLVGVLVLSFEVIGANATWQANKILDGFGATSANRDWIDRTVGRDADVAEIWIPAAPTCRSRSSFAKREGSFWRNEFFSRSIRRAYYIGRAPADNLPAAGLTIASDGQAKHEDGRTLSARYVVVDDTVRLRAPVVAHDTITRTTLYQTGGRVDFARLKRCPAPGNRT
jgi:hypothetical protein